MLRTALKGFKFLAKELISVWKHFAWRVFKPNNPDLGVKTIHILIVKVELYAKIARICVDSFLFYNPNSRIVLHCDEKTFLQTKKIFSNYAKNVKVLDDMDSQIPWQDLKIQLFLSLSGTNEILMDADLRWNGTIPQLKGITFFVNEFSMKEKSPERQLLKEFEYLKLKECSMKNTSFIFLNGFSISKLDKELIMDLTRNFETTIAKTDTGKIDHMPLERLREQIVISLVSETWDKDIYFLKEKDSHMDGSFVESSYFGATGSTF